jgi:hypothetical protein
MTGTLSAPGGALAFNAPTGLKRFFAEFFGRNAVAALPGTSAVAGATVRLIEIDSTGTQVGADIATAVTAADGSFTLSAPAGFVPAPRFVIRAPGVTANLDRLVSDLTSQDVDPASQVTAALVLQQLQAGGNIQSLARLQVQEIGNRVAEAVNNVDAAGLANTAALVSALAAQAQNDVEVNNSVGNLTAIYGIAGTVTDSAGTPLANIKIVARDFNERITRAEARTDANGQYGMNLAGDDYIVGALNFTAASMAASEWWTCNDVAGGPVCGSTNQFSAGKVTVGASMVTANFKLEPGARIQGSIFSAADPATTLQGVQVAVRDFTNDQPVVFQNAQAGGAFRVNVRPGVYTLGARNRTVLPFAGGLYNGPAAGGAATGGGGAIAAEATPVTVAAGNIYTVNFPLVEGGLVSGLVTDGATPTPNPVTGISVRFNLLPAALADTTGAFVEAVPTDLAGSYRMWVRPGNYAVRSRGQIATPTVVAFGANNNPPAVNFGAAVGRATATLHGPDNAPLPQVKVSVYDGTAGAVFQGFEVSNADGTVEVYAQPTGNYRIEYKLDNGSTTVGSAIHDGNATPTGKQLLAGALVSFNTAAATPAALGTISLPAGGELRGTVTLATPPGSTGRNIIVQLRSGGVLGGQRFIATRTSSDGSYSLSVPAVTYNRVCAFVPGTLNQCPTAAPSNGAFASVDTVVVGANQSNTLNIDIP